MMRDGYENLIFYSGVVSTITTDFKLPQMHFCVLTLAALTWRPEDGFRSILVMENGSKSIFRMP